MTDENLSLESSDLGSMCLFYLTTSVLLNFTSFVEEDVILVYSFLAFSSLIYLSVMIEDFPVPNSEESDKSTMFEQSTRVLHFTVNNKRAIALAPVNISFGFTVVFIASVPPQQPKLIAARAINLHLLLPGSM